MLLKHFLTGPIKIQSDSVTVSYFFVDCHFHDATRIMEGNIASLKYYNEGIVSHINLRNLIYLRNDVLHIDLFIRNWTLAEKTRDAKCIAERAVLREFQVSSQLLPLTLQTNKQTNKQTPWRWSTSELCINSKASCRIWGFHSGGYEEYHLLGYDAV
jgi:hypothetical protein